jgi:hypothetical protein
MFLLHLLEIVPLLPPLQQLLSVQALPSVLSAATAMILLRNGRRASPPPLQRRMERRAAPAACSGSPPQGLANRTAAQIRLAPVLLAAATTFGQRCPAKSSASCRLSRTEPQSARIGTAPFSAPHHRTVNVNVNSAKQPTTETEQGSKCKYICHRIALEP